MKILVVDDEIMIREVIKEYLKNEHFKVEEANNGFEALNLINNNHFDMLILDIMMPKMDGFSLLEEIPLNKRIPTIVLSARGEEFDKLKGFDLGIDDYLTKPFSPKELVARVKAVFNRVHKNIDIYTYKDLVIHFQAHTIKIDNQLVNVTPKEFEILSYLINNKNLAISREQLLSNIWGYDFFGDDRTVDTHIKMLRSNLGKYRHLIMTVRGVGYKFVDDEEE